MKYVFDLKGSTINRYTVPIPNKKQTLKDMNFRLMKRRKQVLNILYIYIYIYQKYR